MDGYCDNDRLRQIFEWDQKGAPDPYAGVDLRRGRLYCAIPITHMVFRPLLGVRRDHLVLPVARLLAAALGLLGAMTAATYASLPSWAVLIAAPAGVSVAVLLQAVMALALRHACKRRTLAAADVLAAADKARRRLIDCDAGQDLLEGDIAYINDLVDRVLRDPRATDEQRRRASRIRVQRRVTSEREGNWFCE